MNKRTWMAMGVVAALAAGTIGLTGCGSATSDAGTGSGGSGEQAGGLTGAITVAGSDTMVNMAQAWAEEFMKENPGVEIAVKGGGSGTGIAALINGTVDFANASRELKDEEKAQVADAVSTVVARDGIAVVVNPANPVGQLTMDQLGKIYRGEITNWKAVGGPDKAIVLVSRDPSSGTYEYFKEEVVGKEKNYAKSAKLLPSTQAIVDEVKANADAIGYIGVGYESADIKVVAIDGVKASVETVLDSSYPLSRGLYMISKGAAKDAGKAYVEWILSDAGQKVVADQGYVPVK